MSYYMTRAMLKIFCVSASCLLLPFTLDWLVRFSTFIDLNVFKLFLWVILKMDRCFITNLSGHKHFVSWITTNLKLNKIFAYFFWHNLLCWVMVKCFWFITVSICGNSYWTPMFIYVLHYFLHQHLSWSRRKYVNLVVHQKFCTWCYTTTDFTLEVNDR